MEYYKESKKKKHMEEVGNMWVIIIVKISILTTSSTPSPHPHPQKSPAISQFKIPKICFNLNSITSINKI
jgi:hypothetical protein